MSAAILSRDGNAVEHSFLDGFADLAWAEDDYATSKIRRDLPWDGGGVLRKASVKGACGRFGDQQCDERGWIRKVYGGVLRLPALMTSGAQKSVRRNGSDNRGTVAVVAKLKGENEVNPPFARIDAPPFIKVMGHEFDKDIWPVQGGVSDLPRLALDARLLASDVDLDGRENGQDQREESLGQASERLNGARIVGKESRQNLYHVALLFAIAFGSVPIGLVLSYSALGCWASRRYVVSAALFAVAFVIMAGAVTGLWTALLIKSVA